MSAFWLARELVKALELCPPCHHHYIGFHTSIHNSDILIMAAAYLQVYNGYSIQSSKSASEETSRVGSEVLYAHIYPNLFLNRYGK